MRGQALYTFATRSDWTAVLSRLESQTAIKYVRSEMSQEPHPEVFLRFIDLPGLGTAITGDAIQEPRYLVLQAEAGIFVRSISLNAGGVHYTADHGNNPDSVVFSPGGVNISSRAVISGEVSRVSGTAVAKTLYACFAASIRKAFEVRGAYRVGKEAAALKQQGFRLTACVDSPEKYDLP